jgi:hypothetical protein
MDIFDNKIICKNCNIEMQRVSYPKNGFVFRAVKCPKCNKKIIHPGDEQEYQRYLGLKNKRFCVKLRMVGNSYAVSIPREIINFINEQNRSINELVKLSFDSMGKLTLIFNDKND